MKYLLIIFLAASCTPSYIIMKQKVVIKGTGAVTITPVGNRECVNNGDTIYILVKKRI